MVGVNEDENWHGSGPSGHHDDGLIRVDADGRQELRISPASAFKRPQVGKSVLANACPPPLTNLAFDTPGKLPTAELHKCLKASNWKALCSKLEELRQQDDLFKVTCALSEENDELETTLHTAAWKCPTEITLRMLELTPPDQRKVLLLRRDEAGNTVLHLCCANVDERVEFTVIKNVLLLAPEALEMVNMLGDTPLHLLVCSPGFKKSHDFQRK